MTTISWRSIAYLLRTWRRCADNMSDFDKRNLKELYSGLKQLDKKEYEFLWDKYYLSTGPRPISDQIMSEKYGMTLNQYRNKRNKILNKLQDFIEFENQPLSEKYLLSKQVPLNDIRTEIMIDKIAFYKVQEIADNKLKTKGDYKHGK